MKIIEYNRTKALSYAKKYALGRNPAYMDFSTLGGDCANFCSQCLFQGAPQMNYTKDIGWYYLNGDERSSAWTGVNYFNAFLLNNIVVNNIGDGLGPFAEERPLNQLEVGDFILLGLEENLFFHATIVVGFKGQTPLIASHSRNLYEKPLSVFDYSTTRGLHILGYRN